MLCCQAYCNFQLHGLQSLNTDGEHQADGSHACTLLSMLSCPPNSQPCDLQATYSLSSLDNNNPCARSHRLLVDSCPASEKSTHGDKATHTALVWTEAWHVLSCCVSVSVDYIVVITVPYSYLKQWSEESIRSLFTCPA